MALTDIETIRLLIGDTPTSPFYMLFTDEELQQFLDLNDGNVLRAARMAAIAASLQLAGWSSRERTGDIEVWSNLSTSYLKALDNFIKDSGSASIPSGLLGYAAGISYEDVCANDRNPDNVRPGLIGIRLCDGNMFSYTNPFRIKSCGC
jgi:hypothetical protein